MLVMSDSMGKLCRSHAILHFMTILLVMGSAICTSFAANSTSFGCIPGERNALLKLKASFDDPANQLSSWHTNTDCCTWRGVRCEGNNRNVIGLHLRNTHWDEDCLEPKSSTCNYSLMSNHLDSSLLELKHLSELDLSGNDFQRSPIPAFLGSMKQLQNLNLSRANFSGIVPHNLGNLSNLRVLDLNRAGEGTLVDDFRWASNLSFLEHLDTSSVDLSRAKHLSEVLFHMLPSILVLHLPTTKLNNTHLPHSCVNSSLLANVQYLDLHENSFYGEFPCFLHNMTSLRVLDLSENDYNSSSPHALLRLRNLVHLDLSYNSLHHKSDWISQILFDKCNLISLKMSNNKFYGELSAMLFTNLSVEFCWTKKLEILDVSNNEFTGPIPTSIGKLRALRSLTLSENHLSGEFPISLGQLSNLRKIFIYGNSFNGTLSKIHFAKLSKLEMLLASSINLSVASDWVPPFQLQVLYLESSEIGIQFPPWLRTQKSLDMLILWNCSILGSLPEWFQYLDLTYIDLSQNMVNGSIPKLPPYLEHLDLSHNHIEGPIPKFGSNLHSLSLSDNMMDGSIPDSLCKLKDLSYIDLTKNRFSGHIPNCLVALQNLKALRFSSNELLGVIPNSIGEASGLNWLSLSNNSLTGSLPSTLKNCTSLEVLDVRENMLSGNLPDWIGTHLPNLKFLTLGKNEFDGPIPSTLCQLFNLRVIDLSNNKFIGNISPCFGSLLSMVEDNPYMPYPTWHPSHIAPFGGVSWGVLNQVMKGIEWGYTSTLTYLVNLDLSNNNLVGEIPWELTNLSVLIGLNLAHNHLIGEIPTKIGDLKQLESLDLSSNCLDGAIPGSLLDLDSLAYLNLSHNHLSGPIPIGRHFQTLDDPSIYAGNLGLCGDPLPKKCHEDGTAKSPNVDENKGAEDEDDANEKMIFYGIVASGFTTGFCGIIGFLIFKRNWRLAFFRFAEDMMHKMLS